MSINISEDGVKAEAVEELSVADNPRDAVGIASIASVQARIPAFSDFTVD